MTIKVGINGFGRIGRVFFRTCMECPELEVAAINDPAIDVEYIHYLICFDSTHGKFKGTVSHRSNQVIVNGKTVQVYHQKLPTAIPWHSAGVQYVVEASGMFTTQEKASGHLSSEGVCRVIVTAPSVDVPMVILGVNEDSITPDVKLVSCASSTLYCLAPFVKLLEDNFGVSEGFVTSIHAMTPSLKPLDGLCVKGKHWRDHRSIHQNIIPANTGACRTLGRILPSVKNKLTGLAFRVPIVNVSVLDISIKLSAHTNMKTITNIIEEASQKSMKNIIKTSHGNAVSSDFIGDSYSCIIDIASCLQLKPNFFKFICWYENEYSYACRIVDTILFTEKSYEISQVPIIKIIRPLSLNSQDVFQQTDTLTTKTSATDCREANHASSSLEFGRQIPLRTFKRFPNLKTNSLKDVKLLPSRVRMNDVFTIYTDDAKDKPGIVKENETPFTHKTTKTLTKTDTPVIDPSASTSTHERLEKVKSEFSKMVKITEALLKKSYNNKLQLNSATKAALEQFVDAKVTSNILKENLQSALQVNRQASRHCRGIKKDGTTDSGIDIKTIKSNGTNNKATDRRVACSESYQQTDGNNFNTYAVNEKIASIKKPNTTVSRDKTDLTNKQSRLGLAGVNSKKHTVMAESAKESTMLGRCPTLLDTRGNSVAARREKFMKLTTEKKQQSPTKGSETKVEVKNTEDSLRVIIEPVFAVCSQNKNVNIIITEEKSETSTLRRYQYFADIENPTTDDEKAKAISEENSEVIEPKNKLDHEKQNYESDYSIAELQEKDLEKLKEFMSFDETDSPTIVRSESNLSSTRTALSPTNIDTASQLDDNLYDKLDSESATDSENSFQVHEKLSQVLNITDLTKSLHDLEALDKVCRIIEISDDMSDRLFSSLNSGSKAVTTKKWSFKDLCEKIKLDEFCDSVFGGNDNCIC